MRCAVVCLCAVFSLIGAPSAVAYMIYVPGDYPTVQEGIDHAWNGDTVLVSAGTYYEHVNFNGRNLVLGSLFLTTGDTSYISTTTIDGSLTGTVITFNSGENTTAEVVGFTIQHGSTNDPGGGVLCYNSSSPTIRRNVIRDNTAWQGGGIHCYESSAIVEYNVFFGNHADVDGGGICTWAAMPTIRHNTFYQNTAEYGAGIYCHSSAVIIEGNVIYDNSADAGGGIAFLTGTWGTVSGNTLDANQAPNGGGIYLYLNSHPEIKNSIITNSAVGAGISSASSNPDISYCDVWGNAGGGYSGCSPGEGCISADPVFCDQENGDYHLHVDSPCRGSGEGGVDMGALDVGCGSVLVTAGPDQTDSANTQVSISFYIENNEDSADTFDVAISDALGWSIDPTHYELALDTSEVDTVTCLLSIPYAPIGTSDTIVASAVSRTNPEFHDSDFLTVTCGAFLESVDVLAGSDQSGYADSTVSVSFLIQNVGVVTDSYSVDASSIEGWEIEPLHYDLVLDTAESQQVDFTVSIPLVPLGTTDYVSALASSKTNPFARDSASLIVACNAFVEGWDLIAGDDISTPANTEVRAVFYVENTGMVTDSCTLSISDQLGWDIEPQACTLTLDSGQLDSVSFDVVVPFMPVGTTNELILTATSLTNPYAVDLASLTITCDSRNIYVPADFSTIQAAIDFSSDRDSILVAPGTYYEHLFFYGKGVTVKSQKGRDSTIISKIAGGVSMVSFISGEDSNAVLDGFTVAGGTLESGQGAGISCLGSSPQIKNNRIVNNNCTYGAGIACQDFSSPLISNNIIEDNVVTSFGAGIYCFGHSSPVVTQNVIRGNRAAESGGGVYCQGTCSPMISENSILGNAAFISGGGMCFSGTCSPTITGNLIADDTAQTNAGGGIALLVNSTADISGSTIDANGAALGGGIYMDNTSSATIVNTIVTNTLTGKGIRAEGAYPTIIYCDVWNNWNENYYGCYPGVGCLSEDPLFCDPANGNFHLWVTSPCLGTGQDGANMGALGEGCSSAGDANADGEINIGDVVYVVNYLYKGGPPPIPVAAGDVNCDGTVDVGDIVYLVNYLYKGGPPPCER